MSTNSNQIIIDTVDLIVSKRINELPLAKTITATVVSQIENTDTYNVTEGDIRFVALGNGQKYRQGQQVLVLIPGGDYSSENKVILSAKTQNSATSQLMPYVSPLEKMIQANGSENTIELVPEKMVQFKSMYRVCDSINISAKVKTSFDKEIVSGSYGLKVYLGIEDVARFVLDLNNNKDMFGNTFKFITPLPQQMTYAIDLSAFPNSNLFIWCKPYAENFYYLDNNNKKVSYEGNPLDKIEFTEIKAVFGFNAEIKENQTAEPVELQSNELQLLWYNVNAAGKSLEFSDGVFDKLEAFTQDGLAVKYEEYRDNYTTAIAVEDMKELTDAEKIALEKILVNYEEVVSEYETILDYAKSENGLKEAQEAFNKTYYDVEWRISHNPESKIWKNYDAENKLLVSPMQDKWQNTYAKAIIWKNGQQIESSLTKIENPELITSYDENGMIYYGAIKIVHGSNSQSHYDYYGHTNRVEGNENNILRRLEWEAILDDGYNFEEPLDITNDKVFWYIPKANTQLVYAGNLESRVDDETITIDGYDCYKAQSCLYRIAPGYMSYNKNNTIKCRVYYSKSKYFEAEMPFTFTTKGTMGTDYSLMIYEENNHAAWREGIELKFSAVLRDPEGKILYPVKDTQDQEIPNKSDISPQRPEAYPGIVSATVKINDDMQLTSYLPVAKNNTNEELYYQGPIEIIYNAFGADPLFNANQPRLLDVNGREKQDIVWYLDNQLYSKDKIPTSYTSENYYEMKVLVGKKNGATIWEQPLFLFQNLYGNSYLNKWDGKLSIDKDGGRILASMIGAGHKTNNLFTGVLMGDVETLTPTNDEPNKMTRETGIFGYSAGVQTFGVKTDGTAFLGNRNGGIQFSGDKGYISNADGSVLIDFTDDREQYKNITVSIEEGILNVSIEEIAEVDKENEEDPVKVDDSTQTVKVTTTYNCEQYYVYNQPLNNANKFTYYTDNLDSSEEDKVIITVGQENVKLSGTKNTENNFIEYSYTIDQDDQAFILKINIKSLQKSGTKTVKKTIVKKKHIGDEGEEHWYEDSALTIFEDPVYTWEKEKTSCKRQVSYSESIALSSSLKFQNGKFSFETDNFDLASKNVIFNNSAFTIKSDSRKNIALPEILNIDDKNYLFRTKDFIETSEETEITEFNIVLGAEYTWKIFKEIQNYSTIFELGTNQALAFKTAQAKGAESSLTIKSAGEAADIAVSSTRCTPGGYWVKGFIYYTDKQYFDEDGSYFGPLNTVYCYPGDNGTYLHKTNNTKIIAKKTRIKKEGITGVEFDLMNHTLKMDGGDCGDIYIGVDSSGLSNEDASGKIFIGGSKQYALRIGKFKIDWEGNVLPETAMEE